MMASSTVRFVLTVAATSVLGALITLALVYAFLIIAAPNPRPPLPSEKTFVTTYVADADSTDSDSTGPCRTVTRQLPCWYDRWLAGRRLYAAKTASVPTTPAIVQTLGIRDHVAVEPEIEPAEVLVSVVVPAYNEERRIEPALAEAVDYLDEHVGRRKGGRKTGGGGYEIIIVDDGSTDRTADVALAFAHKRGLHDVLRYVTLEQNRGKGGAVMHGLRHVRGEYVLFADADGASRFGDLRKLMLAVDAVADAAGRGVAIGSRALLVGSEAVVKRSRLRNFLMWAFHLVLTILTPSDTSRIRDTQCGFKLFTRRALPHIIPYMHAEGWIFDIEMLMLAESAPPGPVVDDRGDVIGSTPGIRIAEVPVGWHEVDGSKLNVVDASLRMAFGLAMLRGSWMMGVYRRRIA